MQDLRQQIQGAQLIARKDKDRVKAMLLTTILGEIQLKMYQPNVNEYDATIETLKYFLKNIKQTYSLTNNPVCLVEEQIINLFLPKDIDDLSLKQLIVDFIKDNANANPGMIMKYLKSTGLPIDNIKAIQIAKELL